MRTVLLKPGIVASHRCGTRVVSPGQGELAQIEGSSPAQT